MDELYKDAMIEHVTELEEELSEYRRYTLEHKRMNLMATVFPLKVAESCGSMAQMQPNIQETGAIPVQMIRLEPGLS